MIVSTLSQELRKRYSRRSLPLRKGDAVEIMRGKFKGTSGEVTRVDTKDYEVYIDGVTIKKADGTDVEKAIDPSKVRIVDLFLEDRKRRDVLERKITKEK